MSSLNTLISEISEDLCPDGDIEEFEISIDQIVTDTDEFDNIQNVLQSIETYGLPASSARILMKSNLLSGVSLEHFSSLGLETLENEDTSEVTEATKKSLMDKVKERVSNMAVKILTTSKNASKFLTEKMKSLWEKIKGYGNKLKDSLGNKAGEFKSSAKAHPVQTVVIALLAVVAAFAAVQFATGGIPKFSMDNKYITTFKEKVVSMYKSLKWPFGKIDVVEKSRSAMASVKVPNMNATDLGKQSSSWTKMGIQKVLELGDRAVDGFGKVVSSWATLGGKVVQYGYEFSSSFLGKSFVGAVGGLVGAFFAFKGYILATLFIFSLVVVSTMKIVAAAFNLVRSAFSALLSDD